MDTNLFSDTSSPIQNLPNETLLEIFKRASRESTNILDLTKAPWTIIRVCSRFRQIACSTPSVWRRVCLDIGCRAIQKRQNSNLRYFLMAVMSDIRARVGDRYLDVTYRVDNAESVGMAGIVWDTLTHVLPPYLWRSLDIDTQKGCNPFLTPGAPDMSKSDPFVCLERLSIRIRDEEVYIGAVIRRLGALPRLRHYQADSVRLPSTWWQTQIKRFDLLSRESTFNPWFELGRMSGLTSLTLPPSICQLHFSRALPHLRELLVSLPRDPRIIASLEYLALSNLLQLSISNIKYSTSLPALYPFLQRHDTSLRVLHIDCHQPQDYSLIEVLRYTTRVENLSIEGFVGDHLLGVLSERSSLLPYLKTFRFVSPPIFTTQAFEHLTSTRREVWFSCGVVFLSNGSYNNDLPPAHYEAKEPDCLSGTQHKDPDVFLSELLVAFEIALQQKDDLVNNLNLPQLNAILLTIEKFFVSFPHRHSLIQHAAGRKSELLKALRRILENTFSGVVSDSSCPLNFQERLTSMAELHKVSSKGDCVGAK